MRTRAITLVVFIALTAGCYRATVVTGLRPGDTTVKNEWAHSFIAGLFPPKTVESMAQCPNGAARVQTQHSFLNMVAYALTLGIYSPITIEVQCAAARDDQAALIVPAGASVADAARVFDAAATMSREEQKAVIVRFE